MKNLVKMKTILETAFKASGFKIYELANLLEIDSSLMSRILAGKRDATDDQLKQISKILSVDFDLLMKEKLSQKVIDIVKEYPELATEVLFASEERLNFLLSEKKLETIDTGHFAKELEELDSLQKQWASLKPLASTQLNKMLEYFHTEYTYDSNQIEGNTLSFQETHLVVNEGITIGGKSMKEHLEAINHQQAIEFIVDIVRRKIDFNESILKQIHQLILSGVDSHNAGVYRKVQVMISGSSHMPAAPYLLDSMMTEYFEFYELQKKHLNPVILAAEMHERLVSIHPFIDGNGRTSRLVMNLILLQHGYPIVSLKGSLAERQQYYQALEKVQINHENSDFYQLIMERTKDSLQKHLALCG